MDHEIERIWKKLDELASEIGSIGSRQRSVDEVFRRQDMFCQTEIKRWDEMKSDIGSLNERLTRLEERMSAILTRLESMMTLPWKLIAASAALVTVITMGFKLLIPWIRTGQ